MGGHDSNHDAMSFQWDHDEMQPAAQELWEALEYDSALTSHSLEDASSQNLHVNNLSPAVPVESASNNAVSLEEFLTLKKSRTKKTAVSSTRSSSTIRPHWYRRWHTENTAAVFTVGASSSESDASEVDEGRSIPQVFETSSQSVLGKDANGIMAAAHGIQAYDIDLDPLGDFGMPDTDHASDLPVLVGSDVDLDLSMHRNTPSTSREPLSTVAEEDILPENGSTWPVRAPSSDAGQTERPVGRGIRNGRRLISAELQLHMTDSRANDSDCSWTELDDQQDWYMELQAQLSAFRKQNSRLSLITTFLNTSQRKQVHAMAKMMGLSHLSLGKGRSKRLLLSKCELAQIFDCMPPNRRWTCPRQHWINGWADPRFVVVENIRWDVRQKDAEAHITACLSAKQLSLPHQLIMVQEQHISLYALYMFFKAPDDAASALLALDNDRSGWNHEWPLGCEYVRLPGASRVVDVNVDLYRLARAASHLWQAEQDCSDLPVMDDPSTFRACPPTIIRWPLLGDYTYDQMFEDRPPNMDELPTAPSLLDATVPMSRMVSSSSTNSDTYSSNIGQASLGASTSMTSMCSAVLSDYGSEASAAKKRKRQPTTQAGYKCSTAGCDKSFDRMGDLRKHEKVHNPFRPHQCGVCGQGFMYPKDLRRHQSKKGHGQLGDELAKVPEENGLLRSLSCSAI